MISEIVTAGIHSKYGKYKNVLYPSFNRVPNEAAGGVNPNPIKLRKASKKIAVGILNII
jgi:hypothetical protein